MALPAPAIAPPQDAPVSPHARARELIATLKKQSGNGQGQVMQQQSVGGGGAGGDAGRFGQASQGMNGMTPRRMAAVKSVEEVKTPRGGNTQTLYTI